MLIDTPDLYNSEYFVTKESWNRSKIIFLKVKCLCLCLVPLLPQLFTELKVNMKCISKYINLRP